MSFEGPPLRLSSGGDASKARSGKSGAKAVSVGSTPRYTTHIAREDAAFRVFSHAFVLALLVAATAIAVAR